MRKTAGAPNQKKYGDAMVKSHMPAVVTRKHKVPAVIKNPRPVVWYKTYQRKRTSDFESAWGGRRGERDWRDGFCSRQQRAGKFVPTKRERIAGLRSGGRNVQNMFRPRLGW